MTLVETHPGYEGYEFDAYKLGVWNKDYGFKIIETPGFETVTHATFVNNGYLFVCGYVKWESKFLAIPIKDGLWGERSKGAG